MLVTIPFLLAMAGGVYFFYLRYRAAREVELVDQVTGASFGCVASLRGDAPESWSLERALEHMARMSRQARRPAEGDASPTHLRFAQLAADAARGCEALGALMRSSTTEFPNLYFAVPAKLAQPPDLAHPTVWYRRVLPSDRAEAVELTRQIRAMSVAIGALRSEREMMAQELPIEGRGPDELARLVELGAVPRDRENVTSDAWPTLDGVVVLRRGSIPHVPCDLRFVNRLSCFGDFVQTVSWEGETTPLHPLTRPASISYWAAFTVDPAGALWAIGADQRMHGQLGRYAPDSDAPQVFSIDAEIDGGATLATIDATHLALTLSDGRTLAVDVGGIADGSPPVVSPAIDESRSLYIESGFDADGAVRIELASGDALTLSGSEADGWTSRLEPSGDREQVLLRIADPHRVVAILRARALVTGWTVAVASRPDGEHGLLLTQDFGRSFLGESTAN